MRIFLILFAVLCLGGGVATWALRGGPENLRPAAATAAAPASARRPLPERLTVSIEADRANVYNRPWDGIGYIGGMIGPFFPGLSIESPPDPVLCVVARGGTTCLQNGTDENPESWCHDSFRCSWTIDTPKDGPFALLVYDVDTIRGHAIGDLIDWVIVDPTPTDDGADDVEAAARQVVEQVAPTSVELPGIDGKPHAFEWRKGEHKRRDRPISHVDMDACDQPCRLDQSDLRIRS